MSYSKVQNYWALLIFFSTSMHSSITLYYTELHREFGDNLCVRKHFPFLVQILWSWGSVSKLFFFFSKSSLTEVSVFTWNYAGLHKKQNTTIENLQMRQFSFWKRKNKKQKERSSYRLCNSCRAAIVNAYKAQNAPVFQNTYNDRHFYDISYAIK